MRITVVLENDPGAITLRWNITVHGGPTIDTVRLCVEEAMRVLVSNLGGVSATGIEFTYAYTVDGPQKESP